MGLGTAGVSMNHQVQIIQLAQKEGLDPSRLTAKQYNTLALRVRTFREKVRDGRKMAASVGLQSTGIRKSVPLPITESNLGKCRLNKCGSYKVSSDGEDICMQCDCTGRRLRFKASDPLQYCPDPLKLWDNRSLSQKDGAAT